MNFSAELEWDGKTGATSPIKGQQLAVDMPVEFGGLGRAPCPDELFAASVAGCLLTTFLYFKNRLRLEVTQLKVGAQAKIEKGPEGYRIAEVECEIRVEVTGANEKAAKECMELARKYCHITRTIEEAVNVRVSGQVNVL